MEDKPRILGVDDSLTIRKALELVLKPAGYMLELAATGAEALEKARGFQPAAILLDFILPDMRGSEVCRRLAADPETARIPVVLISAKGAEIQQAYQDASNVAAYVVKPFTPEMIIETLADVLRRCEELAAAPLPVAEDVRDESLGAAPPEADGQGVAADVPEIEPAAATESLAGELEEAEAESYDGEEWEEPEPLSAAESEAFASDREAPGSSLEFAFEALSAGLEGVYVEEVDTRRGAAADEAKSYTVLVSQLIGQLGEALGQVRTGARFALCSDGSIRSLDEVLFDAHRRLCRVLFRASAAGAFRHEGAASRVRVLVACHRDSELFPVLRALTGETVASDVLLVSERFRQLPMITRLYGPSHLVVDLGGGNALWDQLRLVAAMPERRRMRLIGVAPGHRIAPPRAEVEAQRERSVDEIVAGGPDVVEQLRARIVGTEKARTVVEAAFEDDASSALALG
jgi:two-component system phosphate regulon response regulator PhoB